MVITIYFEQNRKCRQVIRPKYPPKGGVEPIVDTVTRGSYHRFSVE